MNYLVVLFKNREKRKIINKFKKLEKTYWEMTLEERYEYITGMFQGFSPNDKVRNKKKTNKGEPI